MRVMLFTAGLGTRLRPATLKIPKPALCLINIPIVGFTWNLLQPIGVTRLIFNTHHLPEILADTMTRLPKMSCELIESREEGQILGSGGGIAKAKRWLEGDSSFLCANGDEILIPKNPNVLQGLIDAHRKSETQATHRGRKKKKSNSRLATLLVMEHPEVGKKFGGVWVKDDRVVGFGKIPIEGAKGFHFTGYQMISDDVFSYVNDTRDNNIFYDAFVKAIADGREVGIHPYEGEWFEVGNTEDFISVNNLLLSKLENPYLSGLRALFSRAEKRVSVGEGWMITGKKCHIDKKYISLGAGTVIGDNVTIKISERLSRADTNNPLDAKSPARGSPKSNECANGLGSSRILIEGTSIQSNLTLDLDHNLKNQIIT